MLDLNSEKNLQVAGGSLDRVQFVRGESFLKQMSEIVKKQEFEI